tara:strand:- start:3518 stop:4366 length:849 start_codon:yes stop_codon:yes gene_type:complete
MKIFFYKLKLLFLRVLCYEKPLRVAFTKFLSLKFSNFRPHYESLIYETSKNAIKLGFNEISVVELGVAGGNGIKSILKYKRKIEKILDIKINIVGFDTGTGLPNSDLKEDLPYFWKQGDYTNINLKDLEKEDSSIKIYEGNISSTIDKYILENKIKIGLIFFDLDLYSSTKLFLDKIPALSEKKLLLPRVFCYFDDLFVADYTLNDINGEPLAIKEFNNQFKKIKLGKTFDHITDFKFPLAKGQIYTLHDFDNENYNKYIGIYSTDSLSNKKNEQFRSLIDD